VSYTTLHLMEGCQKWGDKEVNWVLEVPQIEAQLLSYFENKKDYLIGAHLFCLTGLNRQK